MVQFIDTHNHVGIAELSETLDVMIAKPHSCGIVAGIITTGSVEDFERAREVAHCLGWGYCVGLHPMYLHENSDDDVLVLKKFVYEYFDDPYLVGIGEIGLDFYVSQPDKALQERIFKKELELAADTHLPVSVHSRRALYRVIAIMADYPQVKGALHAFAGSEQEALQCVRRGFFLGFGGAMTYEGSKRVRKALACVGTQALLLETDAPDMAPSFSENGRSTPVDLPRYLEQMSRIRAEDSEELGRVIYENSLLAFPRLRNVLKLQQNSVATA